MIIVEVVAVVGIVRVVAIVAVVQIQRQKRDLPKEVPYQNESEDYSENYSLMSIVAGSRATPAGCGRLSP